MTGSITEIECRVLATERLLVNVLAMISGVAPEGPEFLLRQIRMMEQKARFSASDAAGVSLTRVFEIQRELLERALREPEDEA